MSDHPAGSGFGAAGVNRDAREEERLGAPKAREGSTDGALTCAACDKAIRQDDIVCPHCGTPLVAG